MSAGGEAWWRKVRSSLYLGKFQAVRKTGSFAETVLNWGGPAGGPEIDPVAEAARLKTESEAVKDITGGGAVLIQPKQTSKLPGL